MATTGADRFLELPCNRGYHVTGTVALWRDTILPWHCVFFLLARHYRRSYGGTGNSTTHARFDPAKKKPCRETGRSTVALIHQGYPSSLLISCVCRSQHPTSDSSVSDFTNGRSRLDQLSQSLATTGCFCGPSGSFSPTNPPLSLSSLSPSPNPGNPTSHASMDRIELSNSSNDRRSAAAYLTPESAANETQAARPFPRQRSASLRLRPPSIRIQRPNSTYQPRNPNNPFLRDSYQPNNGNNDNSNNDTDNVDSTNVVSKDFAFKEDDGDKGQDHEQAMEREWQASRRRSSSEPRPGRWSTPQALVIPSDSGERTSTYMPTLKEVSTNRDTEEQSRPNTDLLTPPQEAVRRGSFRRLRRASSAAVNRLSRNRASTVSGASQHSRSVHYPDHRTSEYDPLLVDVLDVIGKSDHPCSS